MVCYGDFNSIRSWDERKDAEGGDYTRMSLTTDNGSSAPLSGHIQSHETKALRHEVGEVNKVPTNIESFK
ncbi:hypothetical protein VNO77_23324 [Canavalia gladiata]|uniref:Uncharacterized protein n=1 Tax=Canavalia gladiata TaxID=3824 RepID=A0AAN9L4R2_CANGL